MEKIVIMSKDVFLHLDNCEKMKFKKILKELIEKGNYFCFISRNWDNNLDSNMIENFKKEFSDKKIKFVTRNKIKEVIKNNIKLANYFIVVGNKNVDFQLAVNNKFLYLVPMWTKYKEDKCLKYGIHIDSLEIFLEVIKTVNNQNSWYYKLELSNKTKIYSLISAHTYSPSIPKKEKDLVKGFENFLKRGNVTYYEILLYHFLASISNNDEFREVNAWGIVPSSGTKLNEDMLNFKEKARYCMKGLVPRSISRGEKLNNIFLRHIKIDKSHYLTNDERIKLGCSRHFDSIVINDAYKGGKLKDKTICIFDDYLTNGNTFEAIRNLLKTQRVKKLIFVSLGRFKRSYYYQDYTIEGNVFVPKGYQYKLNSCRMLNCGKFNDEARKEVNNLYDIFNL